MSYYLIIILFSNFLFSQLQWYNYPELTWKNIETEHFIISYHEQTKRSASEAALVAETVYDDITKLYNFEPDSKTRIIIKDVHDYSNGAAYYYDNKIIIWAKPLDYDLRGSHRWMQDVITHEFTHIVQLGASMKYSRKLPGVYFQILGYEDEKREDVLYGFPNQIGSYPVPGTSVSPWFAEGAAQYMYHGANYDYWDSIRDMIVRDRILNDNLLTFDEMNTFGKKGIGNESVYNQGFSLVKYMVNKYGEDCLNEISINLSNPFIYSINKAIEKSLGISGYELYDDWKKDLKNRYTKQLSSVEDNRNYTIIEDKGTNNSHPVWSPNGKKIAYLSNKDNDYFSQTDLFLYDISDSTSKKIKPGVKTAPSWINDSLLVYSKISKPNHNGSKFFDLYTYNISEKKQERLTHGLRLYSPIVKNNKIYAINTFDGTSNIVQGNSDFSQYEQISDFDNGIQIFSLSIDDSLIIFDAVENHGRKIYSLNINTKEIKLIKDNYWDNRDPNIGYNNFLYSDDKHGIFNLYLDDGINSGYITNVNGGAFMPDQSDSESIAFSLYDQGAYKLAIINSKNMINELDLGYSDYLENRTDYHQFSEQDSEEHYYRYESEKIKFETADSTSYDFNIKPYEIEMSGPFILPRLTYDYNTFKPGLYFYDNDFINKLSILGGLSYNSQKDLDFFLLFDNNQYKNSYFFNFYWVTRNISRAHPYIDSSGEVAPSINYYVDYNYELFSTDIGNRFIIKDHKFWLKYTYSKYRQNYNLKMVENYIYNNESQEDIVYGKASYDYFRGHVMALEYEYEGRSPHYLYNMLPKNGFKIKSSISYENNSIFEEFKVNEDYGGFLESLEPHNTWRYKLEIDNHFKLVFNKLKYTPVLTNKFKYFHLTNLESDDFLYFFGGGLPGIKGYTFYEPTLQGPRQFMVSNTVTFPLFTEKAIKLGFVYLNSLSLGLSHQVGKSFNGKIFVSNVGYDLDQICPDVLNCDFSNNSFSFNDSDYESLQSYLDLNSNIDALDNSNIISDEIEAYLYPDIYSKYNDSDFIELGKSIKDLKERYNSYKHSIGLELKLLGFSFYSYPTAVTYEYYFPISDPWNTVGKQYLRILFDFN